MNLTRTPRKDPVFKKRLLVQKSREYACHYCGYKGNRKKRELTNDHYIPLGVGGLDTLENMVLACRTCNSMKGCSLPTDQHFLDWLWYRKQEVREQALDT